MGTRKRLVIEHNGISWTPKAVAEYAEKSRGWGERALKQVLAGTITIEFLLKEKRMKLKKGGLPSKIYSFPDDGIECTAQEVAKRAGIGDEAARVRLKKAQRGEISPVEIFLPRQKKPFKKLSKEEAEPGRVRLKKDLDAVGRGLLSYHEIERRENAGLYSRG